MVQKKENEYRGFEIAINKLRVKDSRVVKKRLKEINGWNSDQSYGQKKRGDRAIVPFNSKGINEIKGVEEVLADYGLDAWTGKRLKRKYNDTV